MLRFIGIYLGTIGTLFLAGKAIGENRPMLFIYIIGAMLASYLLPIVMALYKWHWKWLVIIPIITSFTFAVPSSFVEEFGCQAGNEEAIWAMRAVPAILLVGQFASDGRMSCRNF